ncbi:MAG: FkbM family methyltransferase [Patescibacteria group bacterium]
MNKILENLSKSNFSLTGLDIGARRGFITDLLPISTVVDAIGFEPDKKECNILNKKTNSHPWKNLKYLPIALGSGEKAELNLYRQRGCSSLLEADIELAKIFSRDDYFIYDGQVSVPVMSLDEAAKNYGFEEAAYMKIDIQGAEMDVFLSGKKLLSESLMGIRIETSFVHLYKEQPLFSDIDIFLRGLGFSLMRFMDQYHWRRTTRFKYPMRSKGRYPFSRGQLIHGDALYLRIPENMPKQTNEDKKKLLELALISMAYGFIDHAEAALNQDGVAEYVRKNYNIDTNQLLLEFSKKFRKKTRIDLLMKVILDVRNIIKNI